MSSLFFQMKYLFKTKNIKVIEKINVSTQIGQHRIFYVSYNASDACHELLWSCMIWLKQNCQLNIFVYVNVVCFACNFDLSISLSHFFYWLSEMKVPPVAMIFIMWCCSFIPHIKYFLSSMLPQLLSYSPPGTFSKCVSIISPETITGQYCCFLIKAPATNDAFDYAESLINDWYWSHMKYGSGPIMHLPAGFDGYSRIPVILHPSVMLCPRFFQSFN